MNGMRPLGLGGFSNEPICENLAWGDITELCFVLNIKIARALCHDTAHDAGGAGSHQQPPATIAHFSHPG